MTPPDDHRHPLNDSTGQAVAPGIRPPIRREHYLSRFGSTATLMTVEHIRAHDGSERRRLRFERWPGL